MSQMKLRRVVNGLKQVDIQNRTGISMSRYSLIENGHVQPKPEELEKIGTVLNATPEELLGKEKNDATS